MAIAILRNNDNRIMNDRQGSDWQKVIADPRTKMTRGELLVKLYEELDQIPKNDTEHRKEHQQAIDTLQAQWAQWLLKRREICAKRYGGVASDYSTIQIPPDDKRAFLSARYIEYENESLTYDIRPVYYIEGSKITCTRGWAIGNERLLEDDETDFSEIELEEPLYFQLWYAQNEGTREVSVQLLVRNEDEEFSELPANLNKLGILPVCEGRVNPDHSIAIGRF